MSGRVMLLLLALLGLAATSVSAEAATGSPALDCSAPSQVNTGESFRLSVSYAGSPLEGATVTTNAESGYTDSSGQAHFTIFSPGNYTIWVKKEGYALWKGNILVEGEEIVPTKADEVVPSGDFDGEWQPTQPSDEPFLLSFTMNASLPSVSSPQRQTAEDNSNSTVYFVLAMVAALIISEGAYFWKLRSRKKRKAA